MAAPTGSQHLWARPSPKEPFLGSRSGGFDHRSRGWSPQPMSTRPARSPAEARELSLPLCPACSDGLHTVKHVPLLTLFIS